MFIMLQSIHKHRHLRWRSGLNVLPVISLFCGSGGLDTGFKQAGFTPVLAFDNEPAACLTFKINHPETNVVRKDLSEVAPGYILDRLAELPYPIRPVGVIGGPPCQAFSMSNVYKDPKDPRAKLPLSYANILRDLNEKFALDFFVFENVMGLKHKMHEEEPVHLRSTQLRSSRTHLDEEPQAAARRYVPGASSRAYRNPG
jgi:DNA (cytosine-5)-methyltransferase 1